MDIFFKCWPESVPPLVGGIGRARELHEFWAEAILNAIWKGTGALPFGYL